MKTFSEQLKLQRNCCQQSERETDGIFEERKLGKLNIHRALLKVRAAKENILDTFEQMDEENKYYNAKGINKR